MIIIAINVLALLWIVIRLHDIEKEVKKGNKDQQEIKTRLTYIRRNINKALLHLVMLEGKIKNGFINKNIGRNRDNLVSSNASRSIRIKRTSK